jgi:hypothetical protein
MTEHDSVVAEPERHRASKREDVEPDRHQAPEPAEEPTRTVEDVAEVPATSASATTPQVIPSEAQPTRSLATPEKSPQPSTQPETLEPAAHPATTQTRPAGTVRPAFRNPDPGPPFESLYWLPEWHRVENRVQTEDASTVREPRKEEDKRRSTDQGEGLLAEAMDGDWLELED